MAPTACQIEFHLLDVRPYPSPTVERSLPPGFDDAQTLTCAQVISHSHTI